MCADLVPWLLCAHEARRRGHWATRRIFRIARSLPAMWGRGRVTMPWKRASDVHGMRCDAMLMPCTTFVHPLPRANTYEPHYRLERAPEPVAISRYYLHTWLPWDRRIYNIASQVRERLHSSRYTDSYTTKQLGGCPSRDALPATMTSPSICSLCYRPANRNPTARRPNITSPMACMYQMEAAVAMQGVHVRPAASHTTSSQPYVPCGTLVSTRHYRTPNQFAGFGFMSSNLCIPSIGRYGSPLAQHQPNGSLRTVDIYTK
ncbi:hypothetical protein F5Y14DRAFT_419417 [Nemania sp. NC0429]|nr:hypothetical protein F5Y14DRAFT_419417 [Nemania sp. NC0429]